MSEPTLKLCTRCKNVILLNQRTCDCGCKLVNRRSKSCSSRVTPRSKSQPIGKLGVINSLEKTYTCTIVNISSRFSFAHLEKRFSDEGLKFGPINSIYISSWPKSFKRNQCLISYVQVGDAINAANYFNKVDFDGLEL